MGYTTDFMGWFSITPPLTPVQVSYISQFCETRRMKRDVATAATMDDPIRAAVGLPLGIDAEFFVGGRGYAGQEKDSSVINSNEPPATQPGLWCHWVSSPDGSELEWDGGEKFYEYVGWLEYVIDKFLTPWNRTLNGEVEWQGADRDDLGLIRVVDNNVTTLRGRIIYEEE